MVLLLQRVLSEGALFRSFVATKERCETKQWHNCCFALQCICILLSVLATELPASA